MIVTQIILISKQFKYFYIIQLGDFSLNSVTTGYQHEKSFQKFHSPRPAGGFKEQHS